MHDMHADLDRVVLTDDDGTITWVVLADDQIDGHVFAIAADEADLDSPAEDMNVAVFRSSGRGASRTLTVIEEDALEERVFDHFAQLMGLAD